MIPTRAELADRCTNPLLKLLILDWRFSCLLIIVLSVLAACVFLPLRIFRTTPRGVVPVVKVNLLELIESRSFTWNARKAEAKGDSDAAMICWGRAIASNPGSVAIARGYVNCYMDSTNSSNWPLSLQAASWLTNIAPHSISDLVLWTKVADKNRAWDLIDGALSGRPEMRTPETQFFWLRARFFARRFEQASAMLREMPAAESEKAGIYAEALKMVLGKKAEQDGATQLLQRRLVHNPNAIPAHEAFLIAASVLKKVDEYGHALESLKSLTTDTFRFEIDYAYLLHASGRRLEASNIASTLSRPRSARELLQATGLLLELGMTPAALKQLESESGKFADLHPTILYALLLLEQGRDDDLAKLLSRLTPQRSSADSSAFLLALDAAVHPLPVHLERLVSGLTEVKSDPSPLLIDFAQEVLLKGKQPEFACKILLQHPRTNDPAYERELFGAADEARNSDLMLSASREWYRLAPKDLRAAQNYCAMLSMFGQEPDLSLVLATQCLEAAPRSIAAKINHIAALINTRKFKLADAMASSVDEAGLSSYERSHFHFLKVKSALSLGQAIDAESASQEIAVADLYPEQIKWLEKHGLKLLQRDSEKGL